MSTAPVKDRPPPAAPPRAGGGRLGGWVLRFGPEPPSVWRLLRTPVLSLGAVLVAGVAGFIVIEGWTPLEALWMVGITLSTIGYGEVHPLSDAGRVFTLLLIVASLLVAGRAIAELGGLLGEDGLAATLRHWRQIGELRAMKDHVIVIGYGRLGREVVADLLHHGVPVLVIDVATPELPLPGDVRLLVGDATHDDVLEEAGISRARAVVVATPQDAVNVYLTLTVRQLNPAAYVVTRIEDDGAVEKARRAGASRVFQPFHLSGNRMAQAVLRPGAAAFVERALDRTIEDLLLDDVILPAGSPLRGVLDERMLRDRFGVMVVAVAPAGSEHVGLAESGREVGVGDTLIVLGPPVKVRAFASWATGA